jgi:branched-subunit amino acid transport protein AzlD
MEKIMLDKPETIIYTFVMGAVIYLCRLFPFIFFRRVKPDGKLANRFLLFVEKTAPPIALTVLCFNALAVPIKENAFRTLPTLAAAALTALLHLWKRNALLSIFGGVALFMLLQRR